MTDADELEHLRAVLDNELALKQAAYVELAETEQRLEIAEGERDRLLAVVDAAREFADAFMAWREKVENGGASFRDPESRRRAAAVAALLHEVRQLDGTGTGGKACADCGNPLRYCDCPDRLGTRRVMGESEGNA